MTTQEKTIIVRLRNEGVGYAGIASRLGLTKDAVKGFCRRQRLTGVRSYENNNSSPSINSCRYCGKPINTNTGNRHRVYCSDACRRAWWKTHPDMGHPNKDAIYSFVCPGCGKAFSVYGNSKRTYCSHQCYIATRFKKGTV
jgi:endogenous inhibitor of DNA gyrase (YacG/DUF329 family)